MSRLLGILSNFVALERYSFVIISIWAVSLGESLCSASCLCEIEGMHECVAQVSIKILDLQHLCLISCLVVFQCPTAFCNIFLSSA